MSCAAVGRIIAAVWLTALAACRPGPRASELPQIDTAKFQSDIAKAVQDAMADAKAYPKDADRSMRLCMILHAHEQYQSAAECYTRVNALAPKRFDVLYCWGNVLTSEGSYEAAVDRLRQAVAIRSDSVPAQLKLAEVLVDSGDPAAARELYQRILSKSPDEPRAHFGLGRAIGGDDSIAEFRRAIELFPRYGAAQFALSAAYRRKGDETSAQNALRNYERDKLLLPPLNDPEMAAVRSLNLSAGALMQRGAGHAAEGHLEEAVASYERAVAADPKLAAAYADLISLYGRLNRDAFAEASYRKAIALDPNEADAYYNFGVYCSERRRDADAKAAFEHAIQIQPRHAEALNNLGAILEQEGKFDQALALFRRAVDANAAYPLAHFHLGRIYVNQGKYKQAIAEFEQSLEPVSESTPAYLYALAATYSRSGNRKRAIELMREARKQAKARGQSQLVASIDRDLATLDGQL